MALGDIMIHRESSFGTPGARKMAVAAGAVSTIKAGELVLKTPGNAYVTVWTASNSAKPVVGTDYLAGYSTSTSTDTATADGSVNIISDFSGIVFLGNADVASTAGYNTTTGVVTQSTYDALVGKRVLLKTSAAGVQTLLIADGATSGLVIEPMDVVTYPGKIAFSIKPSCSYLGQNS